LLLFDGLYRLQREEDVPSQPISRWAYSWRLRIIDLSLYQPEVEHLRPHVVVASQTGEGIFKTTCAESLGKRICKDFSLKINDILWVEHFPNESALYIATFKPKLHVGPEVFYTVEWRSILPNELESIRPFIPEVEDDIPP
jgi:hypothetical protein